MTRKDYILVAKSIADIPNKAARVRVQRHIIQVFRAAYSNFDPDKFDAYIEKCLKERKNEH